MYPRKTIVVITQTSLWQQALKENEYRQSTINATLAEVGFIHCSFPEQTMEIVNRRFRDQNNLLLLLIDAEKVAPPIQYEGAFSGREGTFPHIYGPLNIDAVYEVVPLKKDAHGNFLSPSVLQMKP